jgi:hypothetical protein
MATLSSFVVTPEARATLERRGDTVRGSEAYNMDSSEKSRSIWDQQANPGSWGTIVWICDSAGFSIPYKFRRCRMQAGLPASRRRHSSGRWSWMVQRRAT